MRLILLACLLFFFAGSEAVAQTTAQRAQKAAAFATQLQQTRARIKALAEDQKKIESERSVASNVLREVDDKVSGTQRSLLALDAQIAEQQQALEDLREKRLALESRLSRQRAEVATLIRSAYALGRHQQLRTGGDHLSQCCGPLHRVALHLLRVARVGEVPDDEVAGHDPLAIRQPGPQVIVCFTAGMV